MLSGLIHRLGEHSADFEALQELDRHPDEFSEPERDEVRALLGLYGSEPSQRLRGAASGVRYCVERQLAWRHAADQAPRRSARRAVCERAHARMGDLIGEFMPPSSPPPSVAPPGGVRPADELPTPGGVS